jgi:quercetin dioxygenase-like cupin family protein
MSVFGDVGGSEPLQIWDGVAGWTVEAERVTLALIELDADSVVPEHSHENEQVGILLHGSLRFRIGREERELGPGGTWRIPPHTPHDVRVGPDGASLVEVFAPRRADWAGLESVAGRRPGWPPLP